MDKDKPMSLLDHFAELRRRILVVSAFVLIASILCFLKAESILEYVTRVILSSTPTLGGMMAHFRIALTAGFIIASPVMPYQAVAFLAPALTRREKRVLLVAGLLMLLLLEGT